MSEHKVYGDKSHIGEDMALHIGDGVREEITQGIHHPKHYGGDWVYEPIKVIVAHTLNFCLGAVMKHVLRAGKKGDELTDLNKARWYLDYEIAVRGGESWNPGGASLPIEDGDVEDVDTT